MPRKNHKDKSIRQVIDEFLQHEDYLKLVGTSKANYRRRMESLTNYHVQSNPVDKLKITTLDAPTAVMLYEKVKVNGVGAGQRFVAVMRVLWNFAIRRGYTDMNPWSHVRVQGSPPRTVKWSHDELATFLTTAYSEWKWRNVGLIAHMAYEWAQRVGDMRKLKWEFVDFENRVVNITQSKRGASVHVPINDDLMVMLKQQYKDFGFQELVAPNPHPSRGKYHVYGDTQLARTAQKIRERAGLPEHLKLGDLRRTGATEMVEAGVDIAGIMQVTGHANPQSVRPYLTNTVRGAEQALKMRSETKLGFCPAI